MGWGNRQVTAADARHDFTDSVFEFAFEFADGLRIHWFDTLESIGMLSTLPDLEARRNSMADTTLVLMFDEVRGSLLQVLDFVDEQMAR